MPPKSRGRGGSRGGRGRPRKVRQPSTSTEEVDGSDEVSDNSSNMSGNEERKRPARKGPAMEPRFPRPTGPATGTPRTRASTRQTGNTNTVRDAIPEVLREMVDEAVERSPERPLKKRRVERRETLAQDSEKATSPQPYDDDSPIQFEEVTTPKSKQIIFRESDDESDEDDLEWEEVDIDQPESSSNALLQSGPSTSTLQDLDLTLSTNTKVPQEARTSVRRKPFTKEEMKFRIYIHKTHILCLLAHVDIRNRWCNDSQVHDALRSLFTASMMKFLKPEKDSDADKMSRTVSLKSGLNFANNMWRTKFKITARGMRRALWADREEDIKDYPLPDDIDKVHHIDDFRAAAKTRTGSRDIGAQLYCALLRCAGLDARLVCSLQPLSFKRSSNEPSLPVTPASKKRAEYSEDEAELPIRAGNSLSPASKNMNSTNALMPVAPPRRRLGNHITFGFRDPTMAGPSPAIPSQAKKNKLLVESSYPVYWVEVLCDGPTTKWVPVDPFVEGRIDKREDFEPPANDKKNSMKYVIAFEDDGRAREVTRRYTKAYNSKIRKLRVESTEDGEKWWQKTMEHFSRGFVSGVDDVEDLELDRYEAQEPMPNNAMDFKDHKIYALEQHLKRNEVVIGKAIGKFATGPGIESGQGSSRSKTKKLANVYRRSDVKIVKSADGWYRVGREVKMGEQPVKTVPAKRRADDNMEMDDGDGRLQERAGVGLYTEDQTKIYEAHPVVNGRVPTNAYGNLDIYVANMVPKGGVHIPDPEARLAARIIGVHSADAVTGFEFRGRHGTAVIKGVVVAVEFQEAIEAVIQGLRDEQQNAEDERRTLRALNMWMKFMVGLRIKERVGGYEVEGERDENPQLENSTVGDSGMESEEYVEDGAGGFFPE